MSTIPATIPIYNPVDEVPADVGDCWIGGVLYHRCGAGRKQNRQNAVAPCGELKPHTTPHYWRNGVYQANAAGGHYDITCGECKTRGRLTSVKREPAPETPQNAAQNETPRVDPAYAIMPYQGVIVAFERDYSMVCITDIWRAAGSPENLEPYEWLRGEGDRLIAA